MLQFWKRSLLRGFAKYQRWKERLSRRVLLEDELFAAWDCFVRIGSCTVWEWDGGSRPFFWNWGEEFQEDMVKGMRMWIRESLVPWTRRQRPPDNGILPLVLDKINVIQDRRYVACGEIESLMNYFAVSKGDTDVRVVYDGTLSGLNGSLWAPYFPLPTLQSHLRIVEPGTYMADNDVGECFHNWILDERVRKWCGINLMSILRSEARVWERWERCAMGLRPSPYVSVRGILWLMEESHGDPSDPENVFCWERVELNLPGHEDYAPHKSWVSKRRSDGTTLAADSISFVDDIQPTGPTEVDARQASQVMAKQAAWRGIQDATRKQRDVS
jgi:hypothetical protein